MPTGTDLVGAARKHLGVPYAIGPGVGKDPSGFDCSGLIWWAARELGVTIPHGSSAQIEHVIEIPVEQARGIPGALLFRPGPPSNHDGLSTGAGVIEARTPVVVEGAWTDTYDGGKPRWTRAGLIPGITYPEVPVRKFASPAVGRVTSRFGSRPPLPFHFGVDIASPVAGTPAQPVYAIAPGRVARIARGRAEGAKIGTTSNGVPPLSSIMSGDGVILRFHDPIVVTVDGRPVKVTGQRVGHVDPVVNVGQDVEVGELLGRTNLSGGTSGYHCHLELETGTGAKDVTDPGPVLTALGLTPGKPTPTPTSPEEDDMFNDADRGALKELFDALPTLVAAAESQPRQTQILEAVDRRTGAKDGNLATAARQVGEIYARVNWSRRPDGTPYLISVQGDTDILLRAIAGIDTSVEVDEDTIARAVVALLPAGVTLDASALAKAVLDAAADRLKG